MTSPDAPYLGVTCSPDGFRDAMRRMTSGVVVLTSAHQGVVRGLTATAVCSLCAEPPSIVACVNRTADAHPTIAASARLGVNVLSEEQVDIAVRFSGAEGHRGEEKFDDGEWRMAADAAPLLEGAVIALDCLVDQAVEYGTHTLFICRVRHVKTDPGAAPLIYGDRTFLGAQPLSPPCGERLARAPRRR